MTELVKKPSWLQALADAASDAKIPLPQFSDRGMGSAICRNADGGRFVSVKRRFVPALQAKHDGVEWGLWCEHDNDSVPVAVFREPLSPTPERIAFMLSVLRGWLLDRWDVAQAENAASMHQSATFGEALLPKAGHDAEA